MKQNANWAWSGDITRDTTADVLDDVCVFGSSFPIPRTRPPKPVPLDLEAIAAWNEVQERTKDAYYAATCGPAHQPKPPDRRVS